MTTFIVRTLFVLSAALSVLVSSPAAADVTPILSNDFRLGLYAVFYHAKADDLAGPYVPPGVNIQAKDVQTLYAAYIRRLSTHFQAELALGYPPLTKTLGKGPATLGSVPYDGQVISTARWIAPTLLLEYVFFDDDAKLRPFIGAGVNYTTFYARNSTAQGNAASGGPTKLSLSASVGPAATVGLTYRIARHWDCTASYSISQVKTDLTADTAGVIRKTRISFGPQAAILSVGYSF